MAQVSSRNSFGRPELDKLIDVTINKDSKCPDGLNGFSTDNDQVNHLTLNATFRTEMHRCLQDHLYLKTCSDIHQNLRKSRIEKYINCVSDIIDVLTGTFIHPFTYYINLVSISSGLEAPEKVADDLINAKYIGKKE